MQACKARFMRPLQQGGATLRAAEPPGMHPGGRGEMRTRASGHRKSVASLTHRMLPSEGRAFRVTPVRGRDGDKMGYTLGMCDRSKDLITGIMVTEQSVVVQA